MKFSTNKHRTNRLGQVKMSQSDVRSSCTSDRYDVTSRDPAHMYARVDFVSVFGDM